MEYIRQWWVLWRKMRQGREIEITERALQCSTAREVSPRAPEGDTHQHCLLVMLGSHLRNV